MRPRWRRRFYCAPEAVGRGIGTRLYAGLFEALRAEDIHRFVAVYALPNAATDALHRRFGFRVVGVFSENGRKFGGIGMCAGRSGGPRH